MSEASREEIMEKARHWVREGGADFFLRLVDVYCAEACRCLATLRLAFEIGNQADFTRAAHTLKSSSANLGATAFSNLAKKLELESRAGRMMELGQQVGQLENDFKSVNAVLAKLRAKSVAELLSMDGEPS